MSDHPEDTPKLNIDDDWKAQVEAERDAAVDEQAEGAPQAELPPASFATLVHQLTAQALGSLGQLPGPDGKQEIRLDIARHMIDTLSVLEEKTAGNLSSEESEMLTQVLHELRMLFVATGKAAPPTENPASDSDPSGDSPIIMP